MSAPLVANLAFAGIPVLVGAVVVVVLVLRSRRRRATAIASGGTPAPSTNAARIIGVLAFVYGLLASFAVFGALVVTISMTVQSAQGGGGGGAMTLPIPASSATLIPEEVLAAQEIGGLSFSLGYFSEVTITAVGLSVGAQLLYFAPAVLVPLLHAIVAFGVASLASRIEKNEGFVPGLTRAAFVVGGSLIAIGSLSQLLRNLGESLARSELLSGTDLQGWVGPDPFDLTPVAAGVAVLLVGALMRRGERLQRDTAGLV